MQRAFHTVITHMYKKEETSWFLWTSFLWSYLALFYASQAFGLVLDPQLTWRKHVNTNIKVKKAHNQYVGWRPKLVYWLYISSIRQSITSISLVWWPSCQMAGAKERLSRLQRLVCLGITGVMCTILMAAMEERLAFLHFLNVSGRGKIIRISTLESGMLVLPSP